MYSEDDIQYALETTEVVWEPDRRIDTFGATSFSFQILSELMDGVDKVRIRSGRIDAEQPKIITPDVYRDLDFEGFGEQAGAFKDWLREKVGQAALVRYGFSFRKSDVTESMVHDNMQTVRDRVVEDARRRGDPMTAIILGVDDTWEICLLKFTMEMIQKSKGINLFDFKRRGLL
jgi:hypothetical protein